MGGEEKGKMGDESEVGWKESIYWSWKKELNKNIGQFFKMVIVAFRYLEVNVIVSRNNTGKFLF